MREARPAVLAKSGVSAHLCLAWPKRRWRSRRHSGFLPSDCHALTRPSTAERSPDTSRLMQVVNPECDRASRVGRRAGPPCRVLS